MHVSIYVKDVSHIEVPMTYLGQCSIHTVSRKADKVPDGCYTSFALRQWVWSGLPLGEWALYNVRKVCDDTENMSLAEFIQASGFR